MQTIFDPSVFSTFLERIEKLEPDSPAQWGRMTVAQMMAHCSQALKMALGEIEVKSNLFFKLFGGFLRGILTNDKPYRSGAPTAREFVVKDQKEFEKEKAQLVELLNKFYRGGEEALKGRRHPIVGKFSPQEWSATMFKHLDHHLRQFGV
ncbi:MAG: DinB family protein [Bacteroidota bacterium]